jgi:hypothetical protein
VTDATIRITGDNKSALAAITGVKSGLNGLTSTIEGVNKKMALFTNALVGVGILGFTKGLLDSANQLKDMSNALEINTGRLMEMGVAASASGSSFEGLTTMIGKLEANIGLAIDGNGKMQQSLKSVGIGIKEINTLTPDQIFDKIALAVADINDPMVRAAKATELFGKSGKFFNWADYNGSIKQLRGTMSDLGKAQEKAAAISERLNLFLTLVKAQFLAMLSPIMNLIAPTDDLTGTFSAAKIAAEGLLIALGALIAVSIVNSIRAIGGAFTYLAGVIGLSTGATRAETTAMAQNTFSMAQNAKARAASAGARALSLQASLDTALATIAESGANADNTLAQVAARKSTMLLVNAKATLAGANAQVAATEKILAGGVVTSTGFFERLGASITGATAAIIRFGTFILAAVGIFSAPAWASIAAVIGVIAAVVVVAKVAWSAFGDIIKESLGTMIDFGKTAYTNVVDVLIIIFDKLDAAGKKLREFTNYLGLTKSQAQGNIGSTQTPANAPDLLTKSAGMIAGANERNGTQVFAASDAQKAVVAALDDTIRKLQEEAPYLQNKVTLGDTEALIIKTIADEKAKIAEANKKEGNHAIEMSKAQELAIGKAIRTTALATSHADIAERIRTSDNETYLLSIKDVNEREIQAQKRALIHQYGKFINAEDLANLDTALRINQAKQDQIKIEEAMATLRGEAKPTVENAIAGATIAQTPAEKIQAQHALELNQLNQALGSKLISQEAYLKAVAALETQYQNMSNQLKIDGYQLIIDTNQLQIDADAAMYAQKLRLLKDYNDQQKYTNEEALAMGKARAELEHSTTAKQTQWAISQIETITSAGIAGNKTMFRIQQAASIGKAIMNTYEGATKAFATYGVPMGYLAAAAVVAAGMAQVAQIRSQSYSGKALGGPMVGGQTYLVGEKGPELFTPGGSGNMTPNDKMGGSTNVTFNIVANDTKGFDDLLLTRKSMITRIIADAQLEKGRRQFI